MYSENLGKDAYRFTKAVVTNQLARFAPGLYVTLTHESGRGDGGDDPSRTAAYFRRCFDDYRERVGLEPDQFEGFLKDKTVLEYGPGDVLGVALLMYGHGAEFVHCVDRFPREKATPRNIQTYIELLEGMGAEQRHRANGAFNTFADPSSGLNPSRVRYSVTPNGLINERNAYDMVISRAVLEHVNCLEMTIADMAAALRPDGIAIHNVDLKSHNLDRYQPFDFLTWPDSAYRLMHSHKGRPNRWRIDKYKEIVDRSGLRFRALADTGRLDPAKIERLRPKLAPRFRDVPTDELTWLGFWMVLERA